jgi:spore germination protein GerM
VQRVDDDAVPYRLLDPDTPTAASSDPNDRPGPTPLVFWLDGEHLAPETTDEPCTGSTRDLAERLLGALAAGPSDEVRAAGRSSAIPPDSGLELVTIDDEVAEVEIEPEASLSAERLPIAVGEIVLTLTSVPGIRGVTILSGGEPVQTPLPGGALTDGPVTDEDYADFLPEHHAATGPQACPS